MLITNTKKNTSKHNTTEFENEWSKKVQGRVQISISTTGYSDFGIKFMKEGSGPFILKIS